MNTCPRVFRKEPAVLVLLAAQSLSFGAWADIAEPVEGRIGLVLGYLNHAIYQTEDGKEE